jgi:hypothetical protein
MGRSARLLILAAFTVCGCRLLAAPQAHAEIGSLLATVGERVADGYRRARHVVCLEKSTVQPIEADWSPDGMARTVESDLRVVSPAADGDVLPDADVVRDVRRINGRAPRERDTNGRSGCTDPNPLSPVPLAFLLPSHRDAFRFTSVSTANEHGRAALVIAFTSVNRDSQAELIADPGGHDDCFDWSGPVATNGRVWVDADTHEVLRVERHLKGPVSLRVPTALQRRYHFDSWVALDRDDETIRYTRVAFSDPDEVLLLPESIESMTVLRGGLQSIRRVQTFSHYRRFLTAGRIIR